MSFVFECGLDFAIAVMSYVLSNKIRFRRLDSTFYAHCFNSYMRTTDGKPPPTSFLPEIDQLRKKNTVDFPSSKRMSPFVLAMANTAITGASLHVTRNTWKRMYQWAKRQVWFMNPTLLAKDMHDAA